LASRIFQIQSYLSYWLNAVDEHSLHSPFFFEFYRDVVKAKPRTIALAESLRSKLLKDERIISVNDRGSRGGTFQTKISQIAGTSLSHAKFSSIYNRIISRFNHKTVVELGTSLGINTLYLAEKRDSNVVTFEGADAISDLADLTFQFANASNIELIRGDIGMTLPGFLQKMRKVDFALIDANHTQAATRKYFELLLPRIHNQSVIVIDDIHYSNDMTCVWAEIRTHKLVHGSADLFKCGILFFDPSLNKQHVILQH
jgi:predicted O-methyltransferase YrrM